MLSLTKFTYEVSNFARDLLSRVHNDPLFNIQAINKTLYKKVKEVDEVKVWGIETVLKYTYHMCLIHWAEVRTV
jgi:hypothetical protein